MRRLSNGMKGKIKSSKKEWGIYGKPWYAENDRSINNRVTKAYDERETCVVENAHIGKCDCNANSNETWICDLRTKNGDKLIGFAIWELKRTLL